MAKFKVGRYKTRAGENAVVVVDWEEHGVPERVHHLAGYIERDEGNVLVTWNRMGRYLPDREDKYDLMLPAPRRIEKEVFVNDLDEVISGMQTENGQGIYFDYSKNKLRETKVKIIIEEVVE